MQIWAVEPPAGEMVDGLRNLDDGYIPPIFTERRGGAPRPQDDRRAEGLDHLDPSPRRRRDIRRHLERRRHGRSGEMRPGHRQGVIVFSAADGGWKYLSTGAWTGDLDEVVERARTTIYF